MIPYGKQAIDQDDIKAVIDVLNSDWLTQGPVVPELENQLSTLTGGKYSVLVNSATSALHIAYLALGVKKGDKIWTSPNTFVATANAALFCGASVDFVDIDPKTYNLSVDALQDKLIKARKTNSLPKVVTAVHFAGQSCEMREIFALSQEYGFKVIEDASHAVGGRYLGELVGNCKYSSITIFSFHPVKIITTAEGGAALTNNKTLADKMKLYRSHGITTDIDLPRTPGFEEIWNYQQISLGYNYRMTDLHAALGISQLSKLESFIEARTKIAQIYDVGLSKIALTLPYQHPDAKSSYHLYPVRINKERSKRSQLEIYSGMRMNSIGVNLHYIPVYRHPYYTKLGFNPGYCPESENYFRETVSLPIFPGLLREAQTSIINTLIGLIK